ncbi:hypothetical protein IC582_000180 [Cucumis melo]|uniref:Uncharacterized protein LOC103495346 isoform X1 n=2 Tax=Cucumis melo TaxID=3656 RepID=A0A1S3C0T8_CUCME|nr:uncharacterized protein LOC103495346 [Cucumis melo]XP_008455086.1 uncharacterized protein LOC103495346 [Cucumis melo]KAA0031403.1 uncharacterized protein E6C27_scaffold139G001590 [Cucumis melo var. makuwa]TYK06854.1 uncharacterized protein E5676_scaffold13G001580 [Cucumis melo var. makuwa]
MNPLLLRQWGRAASPFPPYSRLRTFRSDAALEAIARAAQDRVPNLVLYNYPSFSGAFSALFAHLFHTRLRLPSLILPFSSVAPLRVEDFYVDGLERCYFLDFLGPKGFAAAFSRRPTCEVLCFDHRKSSLPHITPMEDCPKNLSIRVNLEKSSSTAVYEYFSSRLVDMETPCGPVADLLELKDRSRIEMVLKYIEDGDLRRWNLPDIRAFNIGLSEWRSKLNCITNPYMYEQLLEMNSLELIAKGTDFIASRENAANKFLDKSFKIRLGRGLYGECLAVRADGNSNLSDEIGKQLSMRSVAAGLRPIGAVIYMQRNNLKMCLRTTDGVTDTSEVSKAYGGGGSPRSSSFMIRMDEYNAWRLVNSS